jgi:glycosyltransferase involved in cell wall biosynthesis
MNIDVSVILFYNRDRGYLNEARQSYKDAAKQFYGKAELIEINRDAGVSANLNEGVRQARGKYIKPLSDDDLLLPNCFTDLVLEAIKSDADLVCANAINWNTDNGLMPVYKSHLPASMFDMVENYGIHGATTLYKRETLLKHPYDITLWTAEEFDLHCRMFLAGCKFAYTDNTVSIYRIHELQKSMQGGFKDREKYLARQREKIRIHQKYMP